MRISDWSSDVCSSDLQSPQLHNQAHRERQARVTILATPSRCGSVSACSGFNIRFFVEASAVRSEVPPTCDQALESNFGLTSSAIPDAIRVRIDIEGVGSRIPTLLMPDRKSACRERVCQYV